MGQIMCTKSIDLPDDPNQNHKPSNSNLASNPITKA